MGITHLIGLTAQSISNKIQQKGTIKVWLDKYQITMKFNCIDRTIEIVDVKSGVYLSNNLTADSLPEHFDEDRFKRMMRPILANRFSEVKKEEKEQLIQNEIEREEAKREQEAKDWEETKKYLNETFGGY
jgi:hypothetical protein